VTLAILAVFSPGDEGPTLCPFALITGTACPGCGLTRAAGSLVRGEWGAAFTYHPLVLLVAIWLGGAWLMAMTRSRGYDIRIDTRLLNRLLIATAGLFAVVWLVRLATGTLPPV
jgi:hypothetical protein